ncbi:MAG TPA: FHA domain-containing protein, partial [Chloroflexi bacterium]|nr:FHA domain-containing protein [Chloroflexota bacterium]
MCMKSKRTILLLTPIYVLSILIALSAGWNTGLAQRRGPIVDILGRPTTTPPEVHTYISVVDPNTGRAIDDLSDANFAVQVSDEDVDATVELETRGVAVVMIIDRGGIARRGDPRIGQAVELVDNLLTRLDLNGSARADMAALIGIRGREHGGLTPDVRFTDFDPNAIRNEFDKLRTEVVDEVTPLYDGIDRAIEWITENDQADTREKLAYRRPIIVVFSDGIDNQFSSESYETIIINKCLQNNIMLYAVRMEAPGRTTDTDNLEALASQTNGLYITHNTDTRDQVLNLFDDIVTQRQSYRVTFPLYRLPGDYQVRIQVIDTPVGDGSAETTASSKLQVPKIALITPADGLRLTVPYSKTLGGFETTLITLTAQVTPVDGAVREPAEVRYFANGGRIGASATPPDYQFVWNVSALVTATTETQAQNFTLIAEADDRYLDAKMTTPPVNIAVTWEKKQVPMVEATVEEAKRSWWIVIPLIAMLIGLLILLILLIRTRGEVARKAVKSTTGVLKGVTKRLGATSQPAPGKLVVVQGANIGKEHRLAAQITKVGRDPQFCDLALYDEFVSNPHFSIQLDQTQFYITDEGSTNGTKLNGTPIPSHQRLLLQPDSLIEVGNTRLQFKRLGGTTRQLGGHSEPPPSPSTPP